jgi:hypothetical protein
VQWENLKNVEGWTFDIKNKFCMLKFFYKKNLIKYFQFKFYRIKLSQCPPLNYRPFPLFVPRSDMSKAIEVERMNIE